MAKFTCEKYPSLRVVAGGVSVKFRDGEVEASGEAAAALRSVADAYGVTEVKPAKPARTSKSAKSDD